MSVRSRPSWWPPAQLCSGTLLSTATTFNGDSCSTALWGILFRARVPFFAVAHGDNGMLASPRCSGTKVGEAVFFCLALHVFDLRSGIRIGHCVWITSQFPVRVLAWRRTARIWYVSLPVGQGRPPFLLFRWWMRHTLASPTKVMSLPSYKKPAKWLP